MKEKIPAISVIIPMYNCEKYIVQCLDSVVSQTLEDYEVIVVDDCSTDRSVELVENFVNPTHTHEGRLKIRLLKLPENSGGAAFPRNQALKLSRGKYITFVDADDLIAGHALKAMFDAAEKFNADVVHSERFFLPTGTGDQVNQKTKMTIQSYQSGTFVKTPTLETNDIAKRLIDFFQCKYIWWACNKLFRRDFLIENRIEFVNARSVEDMIFMFSALVCAKNYVRIPDIFYVYRQNPNSITHSTLTPEQQVKRFVPSLARGIKALDNFLSRLPFFKQHPELKMMSINFLNELHFGGEVGVYAKMPPHLLEPLVRQEFAKENGAGSEIITAHFFGLANVMRLQLLQSQQTIANLQKQLQQSKNPMPYQLFQIP